MGIDEGREEEEGIVAVALHEFNGAQRHLVVATVADDFEAAFFGRGAGDVPFSRQGAVISCAGEEVAERSAFVFGLDWCVVAGRAILMGEKTGHKTGALGAA